MPWPSIVASLRRLAAPYSAAFSTISALIGITGSHLGSRRRRYKSWSLPSRRPPTLALDPKVLRPQRLLSGCCWEAPGRWCLGSPPPSPPAPLSAAASPAPAPRPLRVLYKPLPERLILHALLDQPALHIRAARRFAHACIPFRSRANTQAGSR